MAAVFIMLQILYAIATRVKEVFTFHCYTVSIAI